MIGTNPGELVLHSLLRQFSSICQAKVEQALEDKTENNLVKCMRLHDDSAFQQLLAALNSCSEHALPSLLQTLTKWYDAQHSTGSAFPSGANRRAATVPSASPVIGTPKDTATASPKLTSASLASSAMPCPSVAATNSGDAKQSGGSNQHVSTQLVRSMHTEGPGGLGGNNQSETSTDLLAVPSGSVRDYIAERRDLSIDMLYCQALKSVLKQLSYHPGHDAIINKILDQAFKHFEYKENLQSSWNAQNINLVADMYAEVVGEFSQTRFALVRQHFTTKLAYLRSKDTSSFITHSIISLLMGMKFFRVKMHPIEEFVSYFNFLHELGQYFLEVKEKEIRHRLAGLFVEVLLPVAAVAKHEVNIPALKAFVDLLYPTTIELAQKKKHVLALFPMVTCLLCVGTKTFFLTNWPPFMSACLNQLKSRDLGRVSIESLFRLLWVYIVRIKCEKHADTQIKLQSIVNGLFPKGSKSVLPKNVPSTVFVTIIKFIAQEKLDFAIKEIIFDLLGVNRLQKLVFSPERMNIGLHAFLFIAHGLQQKEGEPPMPQEHQPASTSAAVGYPQRYARRSFHGTTLNDTLCERLGIKPYLVPIRKAFEAILRILDVQVCRNMMPAKQEALSKETAEETASSDRAKIDLLKLCINCIPRLLPYEMSKTELVELLARVSLNVDEEVRMNAQQAMVNLIIESPAYRQKTIQAFIQFIQKYVPDTSPHQLDCGLKTLYTLLVNWKIALQRDAAVTTSLSEQSALVEAEGFALVMLCQCRPLARRLAVHILRESRAVLRLINLTTKANRQTASNGSGEAMATAEPLATASIQSFSSNLCCIDILDSLAPTILKRVLPLLPIHERHDLSNLSHIDFWSLAERSSPVWFSGPCQQPGAGQNHQKMAGVNTAPQTASNINTNIYTWPIRFATQAFAQNGQLPIHESVPRSNDLQGTAVESAGNDSAHTPIKKAVAGVCSDSKQPHRVEDFSGDSNQERKNRLQGGAFCQSLLSPYVIQPHLKRTQLTDVWGTTLAVSLSTDSLLSCHPAMLYTWNTVFQRLSALFNLIDPSAQVAENRASSLLRTTSKKPTTERDQLLPLWHNYVVLACCIAPSSTGVCIVNRTPQAYNNSDQIITSSSSTALPSRINRFPGSVDFSPSQQTSSSSTNPEAGSSSDICATDSSLNQQFTSNRLRASPINSKLFILAKENARDLVKIIIPLLRCEQMELRESVICGLSRIQPAAFRDVLEDLHPLLRESIDRKQENMRRRRRRDTLRASLIRLLALMAQHSVFQHSEACVTSSQGNLLIALVEFIEGTRIYLESINEPTAMMVTVVGFQPVHPNFSISANLAVNSSLGTGPTAGGGLQAGSVGGGGSNVGVLPTNSSSSAAVVTSTASSSHMLTLVDPALLLEMRLYFCILIKDLIRHLTKERRRKLLPPVLRRNLFLLFSRWSGFHEHIYNSRDMKWTQSSYSNNTQMQTSEVQVVPIGTPPFFPIGSSLGKEHSSGDLTVSVTNFEGGKSRDLSTLVTAPLSNLLDSSLWLELIWHANQGMAALVCCGSIYDACALFFAVTQHQPETGLVTASLDHSVGSGSTMAMTASTPNASGILSNTAGVPSTGAISNTLAVSSGGGGGGQNGVIDEGGCSSLSSATGVLMTNSLMLQNAIPSCSAFSSMVNPAPGYLFHWLMGLLMCRDAKLILSPWLWGLPVVTFGVSSTALKGTCSKTGVGNIRLEDQLRSIVISAAGGYRLDSLFRQLGEETLFLLLDMNPDLPGLLEFLIDQCYTGPLNLVQAFFTVIAKKFVSNPEFPCTKAAILSIAMVFSEHSVPLIREHATFLLQALYHRFFLIPSRSVHEVMHSGQTSCEASARSVDLGSGNAATGADSKLPTGAHLTSSPTESDTPTNITTTAMAPGQQRPSNGEVSEEGNQPCLSALADELLWREIGHWKPSDVIRQFCAQHPSCTLPMISEICKRLATASVEMRCQLIKFLHYWTINIELIDLFAQATPPATADASWASVPSDPLRTPRRTSMKQGQYVDPQDVDVSSGEDNTSSEDDDDDFIESEGSSSSDTSNVDSDVEHSHLQSLRRGVNNDTFASGIGIRDLPAKFSCNQHVENEVWASVPLTLRRPGWGSRQATEMVLNNFLFLTIRFGSHPGEAVALKDLWVLLIRYRPANLRYILRYLIVVTSLAPSTISAYANRIITYLADEDAEAVIAVLMVELQTIDGTGLLIEPIPSAPFFRITVVASEVTNASAGGSGVLGQSDSSGSGPIVDGETNGGQSVVQSRRFSYSQPDIEVMGLLNIGTDDLPSNQRSSMYIESSQMNTGISTSKNRPRSAGSPNHHHHQQQQKVHTETPPDGGILSTPSGGAISRLANRFTTSAGAVGRRALKNALHRQDWTPMKETHRASRGSHLMKVSQSTDPELWLGVDSQELKQDDGITNFPIAPSKAAVNARCQTLPTTAAARERYHKQVINNEISGINRPSRFRKILSRSARRTDKMLVRQYAPQVPHRRSRLRSIFKSSGGGDIFSTLEPSLNREDPSFNARLHSASLPPNLASLQPLPLPLHSHSISVQELADFRKFQKGVKREPTEMLQEEDEEDCPSPFSLHHFSFAHRLPMPDGGGYHAPLQDWLTEPFVTNGTLVFSGMWSPTGARSPLVLLLVGEIAKSQNRHSITWRHHMPILLLCVFLGLDHSRPLVQEGSKQLLVNLLRITCPRIDLLRLLALHLEIGRQSLPNAIASLSLKSPEYCLTLDGGPCVDNFVLLSPTDIDLSKVSTCSTWVKCPLPQSSAVLSPSSLPKVQGHLKDVDHSSSASPPGLSPMEPTALKPIAEAPPGRPLVYGSTYSLMSTATLIPDAELKRRSFVLPDQIEMLREFDNLTVRNGVHFDTSEGGSDTKPIRERFRSSLPPMGSLGGPLMESRTLTTTPKTTSNVNMRLTNDCDAQHLHSAAEKIKQLLQELDDRSIWTWEDISVAKFQQATFAHLIRSCNPIASSSLDDFRGPIPGGSRSVLNSLTTTTESRFRPLNSLIFLRSVHFLDRLVRCVAEVFAETEAGCHGGTVCLQCHHGTPHVHPGEVGTECTVTRFAQAAFNMGLTCPNRHYASRSLQIYRSLEAQLDEKRLSEVLIHLRGSVGDINEDLQGYVIELFLTLEAAIDHLQYRGTVLPCNPFPSVPSHSFRSELSDPESTYPLPSGQPLRIPNPLINENLVSAAVVSTVSKPPLHERRHSRRGSTSSLSNVLTMNPCASSAITGGQRLDSSQHLSGSTNSLGNIGVAGNSQPSTHATNSNPISGKPSPRAGKRVLQPHAEAPVESEVPSELVPAQLLPKETLPRPKSVSVNKLSPKKSASQVNVFSSVDIKVTNAESGTCRLSVEEQADLIAGIFWIGVCLLDSDFEYEYLAGLRLLNRMLPTVCLSSPPSTSTAGSSCSGRNWSNASQPINHLSLHEYIENTLLRLRWEPEFPGLLSLLIKGCSSSRLIDASCRLLTRIIPAIKSAIVDPLSGETNRYYRRANHSSSCRLLNSSSSTGQSYPGALPTLIITLLPMLLTAWDEDPDNTSDHGNSRYPQGCSGDAGVCSFGASRINQCTTNHGLDVGVDFGMCGPGGLPCGYWLGGANSGPPPGTWSHRCMNPDGIYPPSSGYLSLVTATVASGAAAKKAPPLRPQNPICILAAEYLADLALQTDSAHFTNLAIVFRLYASGAFVKDVNQWAKCVARYLMDGCGGIGPRILAYLTSFLTLGPACTHLPLLHFAYWFLQTVELNQPDMSNRIRAFITATSEKFVNTSLWPEIILLLQVIVARSATLTTPPATQTYTLPGLDPSGSRVLDLAAAAAAVAVPLPEAEPLRIALAGRVLDFETNILKHTPLIAAVSPRGESAQPSSGRFVVSGLRSGEVDLTMVEIAGKSFFKVGAWKTPWTCQTRLRRRLNNLLSCYGSELDCLAAPRSPSNSSRQKVIFSQSTETLDRQLSLHSSSETASINDASNPDDARLDDTSSAERAAVFHDLDTYLDAQLMNINFLDLPDGTWEDETRRPWGVRGHSITSHADFNEDGEDIGGLIQPISAPNISPTASTRLLKIKLPGEEDNAIVRVPSNASSVGSTFLSKCNPPLTIAPSSSQMISAWIARDSSPTKWLHSPTATSSVGSPELQTHLGRKRTMSMQREKSRGIINTKINFATYRGSSLDSSQVIIDSSDYIPLFKKENKRNIGGNNVGRPLRAMIRSYSLEVFSKSIDNPEELQITPVSSDSSVDGVGDDQLLQLSSFGSSTASLNHLHQHHVLTSARKKDDEYSDMDDAQRAAAPVKPPRKLQVFITPPSHLTSAASTSLEFSQSEGRKDLFQETSKTCHTPFQQATAPLPSSPFLPIIDLPEPTTAEAAWISCMRHLKSEKWVESTALTIAQMDRLKFILIGFRGAFSGVLDRTTKQAAQHANQIFRRCPPSSDLDLEICFSNLVKISELIKNLLSAPFFAIHPNSMSFIDGNSVFMCLRLGDSYHDWEEALTKLYTVYQSCNDVKSEQLYHIIQHLRNILMLLLRLFDDGVRVMQSVQKHLQELSILDMNDCSFAVGALFNNLKPFIGHSIPPLNRPTKCDWKQKVYELLSKDDCKQSLALFASAVGGISTSITLEHVLAVMDVYCQQLWLDEGVDSGLVLMFPDPHMESDVDHRFDCLLHGIAFSNSLSENDTSHSSFFSADGSHLLPPLGLSAKLQFMLNA